MLLSPSKALEEIQVLQRISFPKYDLAVANAHRGGLGRECLTPSCGLLVDPEECRGASGSFPGSQEMGRVG